MKISPRVFSRDEVNILLPQVEGLLAKIHEKKDAYARRHDELFMHELLAQAETRAGIHHEAAGLEEEVANLESAIGNLEDDLSKIREMGCVLRNLEQGWVDFLGRRGEEFIYFCWRRGEPVVQFYHGTERSATERIPLD